MKVSVIELFLPGVRRERALLAYLQNNSDIIEPGSKYLTKEFPLFGGRVDAVFMLEEEPLFVELKCSRSQKESNVLNARDQLIKYYEGAKSLARAFGNDREIRLYLIIGVSNQIENRRYEVEFKEGKMFHELDVGFKKLRNGMASNWRGIRDQRIEEIREATNKRDELKEEIESMKERVKHVRDVLRFQRYGDKMLCLLPNFYTVEKLNSSRCFVCGEKSDVVVSIEEDKTYGLCREHFERLSGFTPHV